MAPCTEFRSPRRDFLTQLATGVATICSASCARVAVNDHATSEHTKQKSDPPANGTEKTALGVALLGLGAYASERLAPGLQLTRHCRLTGLVSGTPSKLESWRERYDLKETNIYSYETLHTVKDNTDIDVIYVVTPTSLHAEYAIAAANAGKHVWCEKPMAMSVSECQSIIDACRQNHVKLSIGYRMQHEPNTQTVIEYAKTKPYGEITSVTAKAAYAGNGGSGWRFVKAMGGGALYDMGVYSINGLRYAVGQEPIRVVRAAQIVKRPELFADVDETTEFELEFPNGVIGHGFTSVGEPGNELRVSCERGSYFLAPMQAYDGVRGKTSDGVTLNKAVKHQQASQMDDDALAILEDRAVMVPGEEGLRDIRLVQAIIESARTGQPVTIG